MASKMIFVLVAVTLAASATAQGEVGVASASTQGAKTHEDSFKPEHRKLPEASIVPNTTTAGVITCSTDTNPLVSSSTTNCENVTVASTPFGPLVAIRAFCPEGYQALGGGCFVGPLVNKTLFQATTPTPINLSKVGGGGFVLPGPLTSQVCIGLGVVPSSTNFSNPGAFVSANIAAQVYCSAVRAEKDKPEHDGPKDYSGKDNYSGTKGGDYGSTKGDGSYSTKGDGYKSGGGDYKSGGGNGYNKGN